MRSGTELHEPVRMYLPQLDFVMTTYSTENSYFTDNLDHGAEVTANSDSPSQAADTALPMGEPRDSTDDVTDLPSSTCTDAGGSGDRPPRRDAEAADHDGDGEDGGGEEASSEGDDDLDVLPPDELDEAAAQHKEDWRLATVAWPEPVDGKIVFNDTVGLFNGFMILPDGAAEVLSLWVFSTYALHACNLPFAPRVMITAPGANSGKTTLLDLLTYLVRHPEPTSDITPASLYRSLNGRKCV